MRRKGFTLLELLIVIGVILFMFLCVIGCAGLVGYGIYSHVQTQQEKDALNKTPLIVQQV